MVSALNSILMAAHMKGNGSMEIGMDLGLKSIQTVVNIRENGGSIRKMEKGCIFMEITMELTMENGETIKGMEKE